MTTPDAQLIASAIVELELHHDLLDEALAAADALPLLATDILLALDICPMHRCDAEICADDEVTECLELRS